MDTAAYKNAEQVLARQYVCTWSFRPYLGLKAKQLPVCQKKPFERDSNYYVGIITPWI